MYLLSEGQVVHSLSIYNSVKPFINRASPWLWWSHTHSSSMLHQTWIHSLQICQHVSCFVGHPFWQSQSSYILVTGELTPQYQMEWDLMNMHSVVPLLIFLHIICMCICCFWIWWLCAEFAITFFFFFFFFIVLE